MSVSKAVGAPYQQLDLVVDGFESRIAQAAAQRIEEVVTIPHDLGSLFLLMASILECDASQYQRFRQVSAVSLGIFKIKRSSSLSW